MRLYRAFATVGGLTMASRLLGLARDILIAAALGTGAVADAFFVAFRFPNLFRRLFGEGAFNAAFVPLFAKKLEGDGAQAARAFAAEAMAGLSAVVLLVTAVCMLAMPWLMLLLAPGFAGDPAKYDLAVLLTQITFPYLLCMCMTALISGILNSMHQYWVAAAAPILLNIVLTVAVALAMVMGTAGQPTAGMILSVAVTLAGFAQLAWVWVALRRAGMGIHWQRPGYSDDMKRLVGLGVPGLISGGITQINIMIGTIIASLEAGAVSYLYYADRLYQLPLGIVGVAVGVVLLPDIARRLRAGDEASVMDSQNRSLEFALMLTLPAAVALAVSATPIVGVLFERGAFRASDTAATAMALAAFALGLPAFVLQKVFQPTFFAREDTKTPMRYALVNMAVNTIGSIVLFFAFQAAGWRPFLGIAVATTLAGWINALLLWGTLVKRGHYRGDARLARVIPLVLASCAVMGGVLWLAEHLLGAWLSPASPSWVRFAGLAALVGTGLAVYGVLIQLTGAIDFRKLGAYRRGSIAAPPQ